MTGILEQDRELSTVIQEQQPRLRNFIRRYVPNPADVEDLLQDVFIELVEANRMLMPISYITAWLYRVARNRITDLFRKKTPQTFTELEMQDEDGEFLLMEDMLPSPDAGPDAIYARNVLLRELASAIQDLPAEQRDIFLAHEIEGRTFNEIAKQTGVNRNTLLARKHYAVLRLRQRLRDVHDGFLTK